MTMPRHRSSTRLAAILAAGLLAAGGLAACGGDDEEDASTAPATTEQATETGAATTGTSTQEASADGEQVFTAQCASCHTLEAAGAEGQVGPNLDDAEPDAARVEAQVKAGGGGMPAFEGVLSAQEIQAVSQYVADNAGK